jgi:hypothetical protein
MRTVYPVSDGPQAVSTHMTRERDTGTMRKIYDLDQIEREYLAGTSSYELARSMA